MMMKTTLRTSFFRLREKVAGGARRMRGCCNWRAPSSVMLRMTPSPASGRRVRRRIFMISVLFILAFVPRLSFAVEPGEMLKDPILEARARELSAELRCLVCQNESIDESQATLAHDLRMLIRQRILAGESNQEIKAYLVSRYGNFILLKPPIELSTLLLWGTPILILICGGGAILFALRRRAPIAKPAALSAAEEERLASLLGKEKS